MDTHATCGAPIFSLSLRKVVLRSKDLEFGISCSELLLQLRFRKSMIFGSLRLAFIGKRIYCSFFFSSSYSPVCVFFFLGTTHIFSSVYTVAHVRHTVYVLSQLTMYESLSLAVLLEAGVFMPNSPLFHSREVKSGLHSLVVCFIHPIRKVYIQRE